jgi:hypothetical protein
VHDQNNYNDMGGPRSIHDTDEQCYHNIPMKNFWEDGSGRPWLQVEE